MLGDFFFVGCAPVAHNVMSSHAHTSHRTHILAHSTNVRMHTRSPSRIPFAEHIDRYGPNVRAQCTQTCVRPCPRRARSRSHRVRSTPDLVWTAQQRASVEQIRSMAGAKKQKPHTQRARVQPHTHTHTFPDYIVHILIAISFTKCSRWSMISAFLWWGVKECVHHSTTTTKRTTGSPVDGLNRFLCVRLLFCCALRSCVACCICVFVFCCSANGNDSRSYIIM